MKRVFWALLLAGAVSLAIPLSAGAAEYSTFAGCDDLSEEPIPSHVCEVGDFPGAYFESDVDTEYDVCVEFPSGSFLCAEEQFAEAGVLYVNSITSEQEGNHFLSWYVEGVEVGSWTLRLDPPPPPPAPPATPPQVILPPTTVPAPVSADCPKAQRRVGKLKARLQLADGRRKKAKIRAKLRVARAAARQAC